MNVVQGIVLLMMKINHPGIFQNTLSEDEVKLGTKINSYNLHTGRNLGIMNDNSGKTFFTWHSETQYLITCPVNENGFIFSQIGVFTEKFVIDVQTYFNFDPDKLDIVSVEVEENKSLLKMLSRDVEEYLR